jgi:pyruvate dehydrogenase E1 component alpha subunit
LTPGELLRGYQTMRLIREFEEAIRGLQGDGKVPGFMHVSVGQEAIPAGVSLPLTPDDLILSTHRGHGDLIAKGVSIEPMLAEILGKSEGICRGKGGSMHITDVAKGVLGANGIVAAGMPIAVGAALGLKLQQRRAVVVCYCGDGAIANGASHEALNMASLWKVPVVFVRVNNQYAESTPTSQYQGMPDVVRYVESYGLSAERVDGNDLEAVSDAARRALDQARSGGGGSFLECLTYRKYGHNVGDPGLYRPPEEVAQWAARDPLELASRRLRERHGMLAEELEEIDRSISRKVAAAVRYAEQLPEPAVESAFEDVYSDPVTSALVIGK